MITFFARIAWLVARSNCCGHLGRQLHSHSLLDDQAHALEQLIAWVEQYHVDAVLLAGDLYDRSVPATDAVALLSRTLDRICGDLGVPLVMIPGNHDSAERVGFAAAQLERAGLHVRAELLKEPQPVLFKDAYADLAVYAFPYVDPPLARTVFGQPFANHDEVYAFLCEQALAHNPSGRRLVVVAHAFVDGGDASESERPLSIGGSDRVDAGHFSAFNYAALGHLHRPQSVGQDSIRYSGSLAKFSFSEVTHDKGACLVDMDADGSVSCSHLSFSAKRDVRVLEGLFEDLITSPRREMQDDYLMIRLLDRGAILDAMPRLRSIYPHVLHLERPAFEPDDSARQLPARREHGVLPLFDSFMHTVTGEHLDAEQRKVLGDVLDNLVRETD
ncbi:MAG: exonuclease SbcCD subunit D [Pseudomonadota bacterium]